MPVTLICSCGHRFDMPTARFQRDGARCPKCRAIVLTRVKPKPKPKPCPAAPRTPHPMMAMQEGKTAQEAKAENQALTEAEEHLLDAEESPAPASPAQVDTAMLKAAWARVQARKGEQGEDKP